MSRINFQGLASGIQTDTIVEQLTRFSQRRIDTLKVRQGEVEIKQAVFQAVELKLLSLRTDATRLARSTGGAFDAVTATSSDESLIKAAAGSGAKAGVTSLRVDSLAKAHQVASQGFASANATINQGTFKLKVGSGATQTLTIDASNNSLQGLAAAINSANAGVQASVINEGAGRLNPFRLLLTSTTTGTAGAITITNELDSGGAVKPDFATVVQAATDATVKIGSGAGELTITNSSNQIKDLIPGVTLDLKAADATKEVKITVANDTAGIKKGVTDFVKSFNDLMDFFDQQTRFDPATNKAGPLQGHSSAIELQNAVRQAALSSSSILPTTINRLSAFGVSITRTGKLSVDEGKLDNFLNGNVPGVSLADVKRGFAFTATTTNAGVQFSAGTNRTKEAANVQVDLSQAAEQATLTAGNALGATTTIDGTNNQLVLKFDGGPETTITLATGTYSSTDLAKELGAQIQNTANGRKVSVAVNADNKLVLSSGNYGFASELAIVSGSALTSGVLGFAAAESRHGRDVVGKFIVDGKDEAAIGTGQVLRGDTKNATTADLQVVVSLGSSQITAGAEASLTVTRGAGARIQLALDRLTDVATGRLKSIREGFDTLVRSSQTDVKKETDAMEKRKESLLRQFAALESVINRANTSRDTITNSLSSLLRQ